MQLPKVLVAAVLVLGCPFSRDSCANTPVREAVSPDGRLRAVVFIRDCGATTALSAQVGVVSVGKELPNEAANAFIPDHRYGGSDADSAARKIVLEWRADTILAIAHQWGSQVFRAEARVAPVRIVYEDLDPPGA